MLFTVATALLLDVHVPPAVLFVKVVVEPTHAFVVPPIAANTGNALTFTITWSVFTQPFASVPVTV